MERAVIKMRKGQGPNDPDLLMDGLENLVAQLGTGQDKRNASKFVNAKRLSVQGNHIELNALYRTNWAAGKVVDIIPNDMTREWRTFSGEITPEQIKILEEEEDRLLLISAFRQAHKWARLYGTAFIVMSVDDGNFPEEPLDMNRVTKGSLRHIKVVDRHRINHAEVMPISDPLNPSYGMPEFYRFNETSVKIHYTRVLRFDGVLLPFDEFRRNNYFSDSVLDRMYDTLTNFSTVSDSAASMVYETNVDIMKIKNFMSQISTPQGEELLRKRMTLAGVLKSFNNMLLLDTEEDFETKTQTFSGLPDLMDRYGWQLSAASDIPATRFLGQSASGLNATGEGDLKNYYDKIAADQVADYKPQLDYFDHIMAKSLGFVDDSDLSYKFDPLFQMTETETAAVELSNAQRDALYWDRDIVTDVHILKDLKQNNVYTNISDEDIEQLEEEPDNAFESPSDNPDTGEQEEETKENPEEGEDS